MSLFEGAKWDDEKVPLDLLSPYFLLSVAEILQFGAEKYEPYNWAKGIKYSRVYAAMQRHLNAYWAGEENDEETGKPHLWHAGCCLMFLIHYEYHPDLYKEFDDRPNIYTQGAVDEGSGSATQEFSGPLRFSRENLGPIIPDESDARAYWIRSDDPPGADPATTYLRRGRGRPDRFAVNIPEISL